MSHDAGLVTLPERPPYAVAILSEWEDGSAGAHREAVARLSRTVYDHVAGLTP